jgi:hypothetical protein
MKSELSKIWDLLLFAVMILQNKILKSHPPVVDSTSHSCNSLSSLEFTLVTGFNVSF